MKLSTQTFSCTSLLLATVGLASPASAALVYMVVDLGTNGAHYSEGRALNGYGQCAGFTDAQDLPERAYRTDEVRPVDAATDDLGTLGGTYAIAYGVNSLGQAVGLAGLQGDLAYRAFRTGPNDAINPSTDNLGLLIISPSPYNLSLAYDINASGQVVGVSDTGGYAGWPAHAFRTQPNSAINPSTDDLGTLGGTYSEARAINNIGEVTGLSDMIGDATHHAFRTAPNAEINPATDDLGTLGGDSSVGRDINASGVVVGEAQIANGEWRAYRTTADSAINAITDNLGTLGGDSSRATAVNNQGDVVGFSTTTDGVRHAFLYTDGDGILDLNQLLLPASSTDWVFVEARGIDDDGRIIGTGAYQGRTHGLVLVPAILCDVNGDGNVDGDDVASFVDCLDGPASPPSAPCSPADLDEDQDVDLVDFGTFENCLATN